MQKYNPKSIEPKWQKVWADTGLYSANLRSSKPKYMAMSMFNYPSGAGIHVGHAMNYTISDVKARFKRQQGYESYHPVGWDAFGLPAENYAIKAGVSPQKSMAQIIPSYHKQYKAMGWSNDWEKEISTHTPEYYKWTQWIFSQMYKKGLAYQDTRMQWWCDKCQTVLANEQVIEGKCWRHDGPNDALVKRREVKQWFLKISEYADELLEAIDDLEWTESVKLAQKNWIGKSQGAEVDFKLASYKQVLVATNNSSKIERIKNVLAQIKDAPQVLTPADLKIASKDTKEGSDLTANAIAKAKAYVGQTKLPVLGTDSGIFIEGENHDPAKVKRNALKGKDESSLSQAEQAQAMIEHYQAIAERRGGQVDGYWLDVFALVLPDGSVQTAESKREVTFTTKVRKPVDEYFPMRSLYINKSTGKYAADQTESEELGVELLPYREALATLLLPAIKVFTTRPDTLFGATFLVVAPESELLTRIVSKSQAPAVAKYIRQSAQKSEIDRQANKDKTGVFTGSYALNPITNEKIPIWVADYVLEGYGTGAIMAVPAHDQRDYEFARKYNLPVRIVIEPTYGESQGDETFKKSVFVVLRNPKTNKVMVLDWGPRQARHGGQMLIGGGVEKGEGYQAAAEREIVEETGYKNFSFVRASDFLGHSYFYSNTKNKNMHVSGRGLLYDLVDEGRADTALDEGEKDKFTLTWQPIERVGNLLDDGIHEAMFRYLALEEVYTGEGLMINSKGYDGLDSAQAREKIVSTLAKQGLATEKITYKMRDWSVSRQRYWGAPIPIINCERCGAVLVDDKDLPVVLPELTDFEPSGDGRSALGRASEWVKVKCPQCGGPAERETDTLDTYLDSAWYMLRYIDPHNQNKIFDSTLVNKWLPIDFYNGADHATAHLLYARFICRFFNKLGLVNNPEPFKQMLFNGKVTAKDGGPFSKSKGTGVDPLEIINSGYGADALRLYLMFAAPLEQGARWDPQGVPGTYRFLNRLWNLIQGYSALKPAKSSVPIEAQINQAINQMIKKITADIEASNYNTAIAAAMGTLNKLYKLRAEAFTKSKVWQQALDSLVACIAPFAPHISEELWQQLGHSSSVHLKTWPAYDEKSISQQNPVLVVQVNGKVRASITIKPNLDEKSLVSLAQTDTKVAKYLAGKKIHKTITIKNKLVNFVTN